MTSNALDNATPLAGRLNELRRQAATLSSDRDPLPQFIRKELLDKELQLHSFDAVFSHPRLLLNAARKKQIKKHEMNTGGLRVLVKNDEVIGGLHMMSTSLVSDEARRASRSKVLARQYLDQSGVPAPAWQSFAADYPKRAYEFASSFESATVKPATGHAGDGVSNGVTGDDDFYAAWHYAKASRRTPPYASREIIVEETVPGLDIRCFVVGEALIAACARVPAFAVGDGRTSAADIRAKLTDRRAKHANLQLDSHMSREECIALGLTAERTPAVGQLLNVSGSANPGSGGWPVDVTSLIASDVSDLAVEALWAIPGLTAGAIDMKVPDLGTAVGTKVIEIKENADISIHHYPAFGTPRAVAEAVIQQMLDRSRRTG